MSHAGLFDRGTADRSASPRDLSAITTSRRLSAILAADVAGYSRLMGADEERTHERLKTHRRQLVDPKIKDHHGRIVKTTGDGMLVEFPSVVDAVRCAVEMQRAMIDRNADIAEDKRITFRIGVNLGDVIAEGGDIYGDGVNVAARLEALAEPGGICISGRCGIIFATSSLTPSRTRGSRASRTSHGRCASMRWTQRLSLRCRSSRRQRRQSSRHSGSSTKAFPICCEHHRGDWHRGCRSVVAMAAGGIADSSGPGARGSRPAKLAYHRTAGAVVQTAAAPRLSIVVLPFTNLSNDPDQEYFVDGITDDLTTDLSQISDSLVIARNTAFTYKGKPSTPSRSPASSASAMSLKAACGGWVTRFRPMCS